MQQAFINAFLYPDFEAMGKKLLPLSLGHLFLLDIIHSPFSIGGTVEIDDLITAIFLCSNDWQNIIQFMRLPNEEKQKVIIAYSQTIYKRKWYQKRKFLNYEFELVMFRQYLNYFSKFPRRWETEGKGNKTSKVPWQLSVMFLLKDKYQEDEVWNMPITKVMALVACHENSQGESNLANETEAELLDQWEKEELEAEAVEAENKGVNTNG